MTDSGPAATAHSRKVALSGPAHSDRGLDRLVNFSDATVAIAITLLVLPLVSLASELERLTLGELLAANAGQLISFFLTFAVLSRLWMIHHRVFDWLLDYTTPLLWWNTLWLASMVLLPFAAEMLSFEQGDDAGAIAFYLGTVAMTMTAMLAILVLMKRHPELVREDMRRELRTTPMLAGIIVMVLVVIVVLSVPAVGPYGLLILLLAAPISGLIDRARRRSAA